MPALRGRLLLERQYIDRFGLFDRLACRYDEHEHDIPDNQLLALALREGSRLATLPRVRRRARGLALALEEVCNPDALDLDAGSTAFSYSRHNEHYRSAHELAWMVVGQRGLDESLTTGAARVRSFLIDMNTLFERFLEKLLKVLLEPSGIAVRAQRADSIFWRPATGTRYARVRPDLLLERNERRAARLPIDAKYKRYDRKKVDVDDLTQTFLYGYAYRDPEAVTPPAAVLIHPSETPGSPQPIQLQVRSVEERGIDANLTILGVHIPSMLDEVDARGGPGIQALHDLLKARVPPLALPLPIAATNADG